MTSIDSALNEIPASHAGTRALTRHAATGARFLLGAVFFVFGLNGFLNFIPPPPANSMSEGAMAFGAALMHTGYLFQVLKGTEVIAGALLLANRFVPLALAVLAPIVINIVLFHSVLAPSGVAMALIVLVLELYLAWAYRAAFKPMLQARTTVH